MRIVSAHQRTAGVRAKNTKKWIEKEDIEGLNLNKRISESNICCYNGKEQVNLAVASLVEAWIETLDVSLRLTRGRCRLPRGGVD